MSDKPKWWEILVMTLVCVGLIWVGWVCLNVVLCLTLPIEFRRN